MGIDFHAARPSYLSGKLLIATPAIHDGVFDKSVVYLCEHNALGAMGVIVNRAIASIRLGNILQELHTLAGGEVGDLPVHFGGPVESHRGFIVHTADVRLPESVVSSEGGEDAIAITASLGMLKTIAQGRSPRHALLALGYAGWAAGQLEDEIASGSWITAAATPELIFQLENANKWALAGAAIGVSDMYRLSTIVGHA